MKYQISGEGIEKNFEKVQAVSLPEKEENEGDKPMEQMHLTTKEFNEDEKKVRSEIVRLGELMRTIEANFGNEGKQFEMDTQDDDINREFEKFSKDIAGFGEKWFQSSGLLEGEDLDPKSIAGDFKKMAEGLKAFEDKF
mmetsp:Transcript_28859/g.26174  ORF Transcript_28859/g.26174 Transcript_28859/m.26174 type:complete len:139 (+) Transcript_28859:498-914(+)